MSSDPTSTNIPEWSRLRQDLGAVAWSGFLAACFASLLFFAYFDPILLSHDDHPPTWLADRMTGYAVGFFFFWLIGSVAAFLTAWLLDTPAFRRKSGSRDSP